METLNIQCIEQQQVLITLTLTDSNGAPVDLTQYAVYAASVGAVDPYCRRAARLEWAAAINNECSAFIVTAPGHDIARAPWKYQICIKSRQLGLEWAVVTGRIELTPRACGTDGISPASYTVACEATPSGLVNVTLDATVGSISETLEQVKASAAAAAAAAQNAHADLEDAETAATKASQAALAAAADARIASDKAIAAEAAATAAPEACAPYVQQVQQAAAAALDASRTATTAAAGAQASADAAAPAQGYATRAESAQAAAAQAAADAGTAATTATQQAESATAQAESARLAATTATTAADNAQQAATRAEDAAARAEAAVPAADRAESARDAAEAAAATATTAAVDVPGLVTRAETAATASEAAQQAAETAQSAAETAASTATAQAEAAAASAAQSDTDARACAIYDQRVSANASAAADSAAAAADSAAAAADSAAEAAASAMDAMLSEYDYAAVLYSATKEIPDGVYYTGLQADGTYRYCIIKNAKNVNLAKCKVLITHGDVTWSSSNAGSLSVLYTDDSTYIGSAQYGWGQFGNNSYIHAPSFKKCQSSLTQNAGVKILTFSPATKFEQAESIYRLLYCKESGTINWAPGTTMSSPTSAVESFAYAVIPSGLPDEFTFANVTNATRMFSYVNMPKLPASMNLSKCVKCNQETFKTQHVEIEDIVRVCLTLPDLTQLETPTTCPVGLSIITMHDGQRVESTERYLKANHPDFLITMAARGWTVIFS